MATNRIETLDPALIRPGRIDRKIEFPLPDEKTKRRIFNIHTARMTLADDVNIDEYIMAKDDLSGADVKVSVFVRSRGAIITVLLCLVTHCQASLQCLVLCTKSVHQKVVLVPLRNIKSLHIHQKTRT